MFRRNFLKLLGLSPIIGLTNFVKPQKSEFCENIKLHEDFEVRFRKIVADELVPTVECSSCGYKWCCFEGLISEVKKIHDRPCDKCGGKNILIATNSEP